MMTQEQELQLRLEMENYLSLSKRAQEKGNLSRADKNLSECFAIARTLRILGYEVTIDEDNLKVQIEELMQ